MTDADHAVQKTVSDPTISGMSSLAASYRGFADLAIAQTEGTDYRMLVRPIEKSSIAVIAPHGGSIEQYTSDIARGVAGGDFNLYLFEGIRQAGNYSALHLTSHQFERVGRES
jgi:phage replication-related protein YjqB (UPF0714/DUF867 family)